MQGQSHLKGPESEAGGRRWQEADEWQGTVMGITRIE